MKTTFSVWKNMFSLYTNLFVLIFVETYILYIINNILSLDIFKLNNNRTNWISIRIIFQWYVITFIW